MLFDLPSHNTGYALYSYHDFAERLKTPPEVLETVFKTLKGQRGDADMVRQRRLEGEKIATAALWLLSEAITRNNQPMIAESAKLEILPLGLSTLAKFIDTNRPRVGLAAEHFTQETLRKYWNSDSLLHEDLANFLLRPSVVLEPFEHYAKPIFNRDRPDPADVGMKGFENDLIEIVERVYRYRRTDPITFLVRQMSASAPLRRFVGDRMTWLWNVEAAWWTATIEALGRATRVFLRDEHAVHILAAGIQLQLDGAIQQWGWAVHANGSQAEQIFNSTIWLMVRGFLVNNDPHYGRDLPWWLYDDPEEDSASDL